MNALRLAILKSFFKDEELEGVVIINKVEEFAMNRSPICMIMGKSVDFLKILDKTEKENPSLKAICEEMRKTVDIFKEKLGLLLGLTLFIKDAKQLQKYEEQIANIFFGLNENIDAYMEILNNERNTVSKEPVVSHD